MKGILLARDKKVDCLSYMQSIISHHNIKNCGYTVNASNSPCILTESTSYLGIQSHSKSSQLALKNFFCITLIVMSEMTGAF